MRYVLLSPELFLAEGGIARIMRSYLKALCDLSGPGDEVRSIVLNDRRDSDPRLGRYSSAALRSSVACARNKVRFVRAVHAAATGESTLVCGHLHQLPVAWLASRLRPRCRYFLVAHGIEVWRPYSMIETVALRGAAKILCISEYTRRQMLRFCPSLDPARVIVLPNALDPFFEDRPEAPPAAGGPHILTVGRLTTTDTYKGCDTLIEAVAVLRRWQPTVQLRVVGGGGDLPRLQALAQRLGITPAVTFTGIVDDETLRREYQSCQVFALPSRCEGFGLVYLEAMTYGKPCLAARAGGAPEVINEQVGALAEYADIHEIAAALNDLLLHPRDPQAIRRHAHYYSHARFTPRLAATLAR